MALRKLTLAKLTAPRLKKPLVRKRLFKMLDEGEQAVWIQGAPGAGKTTLVASYLQQRGLKPLWFQIDSDDREPSTFFHFLAEAKAAISPRRSALPAIGLETRADWSGFARRFARALLLALPAQSALVFDNVHEGGPILDEILAVMVSELTEHHRLFLISYRAPPAPFVNAIIKRQLSVIANEALCFDRLETAQFAQTIGLSNSEDIKRIQESAGGWAAGIVLLAHQPDMAHSSDTEPSRPSQVLDYISDHLIEWLPASTRLVVERCAFFPDFDAGLACVASGEATAGEQIAQLNREGFFVERRGAGAGARYALHSLLAEAVRNRIGPAGSETRRGAEIEAGKRLVATGRVEAGIALLLSAQAFEEAAPCILDAARRMLATGREEQLANWIVLLPATLRAEQTWLDYWRANAVAAFDESETRKVFAVVYRQFQSQNDRLGMMLAASAIMAVIHLSLLSYSEIDHWVSAFESVWDPDFIFDSPEDELRVVIGMFVAAAHRSSFHEAQSKKLSDYIDNLQNLIAANSDPTLTLTAGELILDYLSLRREYERGLLVESQIEKRVDVTKSNPKRTAFFLAGAADFIQSCGMQLKRPNLVRKADQYRKQALLIVERFDLLTVRILLAHTEASAALQAGNVELAGQILDSAELLLLPSMSWQRATQMGRQARLQLLLGRPLQALDYAQNAIEFARSAHQPAHFYSYFYYIAANCMAWLERYDDVTEFNQTAIAMATTAEKGVYLLASKMFDALRALKEVPDKASEPIRQFFLALHQEQGPNFGGHMRPQLARLCSEALKRGIEPEITKELIRRRKLVPPSLAPANWPWPLRIDALGEFSVTVADAALTFEGKGQKKPLELLKLLVSLQGTTQDHAGPTVQRILDELWPDVDARDPQGSFEIALHRLRKLLGVENVIVMAEGRVSLNRELAWWDVAAFETLARSELFSDALKATRLYAGPLLRSAAFAWVAAPRERLAAMYTLLIERCAHQLESNKDYQGAIRLYERALQQDNLIEPFYRGLMRSHMAMGESNEALRVYRRCRDLLSVVLGTKPTADTEALKTCIAAGWIGESWQ